MVKFTNYLLGHSYISCAALSPSHKVLVFTQIRKSLKFQKFKNVSSNYAPFTNQLNWLTSNSSGTGHEIARHVICSTTSNWHLAYQMMPHSHSSLQIQLHNRQNNLSELSQLRLECSSTTNHTHSHPTKMAWNSFSRWISLRSTFNLNFEIWVI